jgi:hypothetical protein
VAAGKGGEKMSVVKGAIGIKDNMTVVLRSIKKEQTAFRKDVEKTRKEMRSAWDKKHEARLQTTSATKKLKDLQKKLAPLRKKIVQAVAIKDMITSKIKAVGSKLKTVGSRLKAFGKITASPMIKLKDSVTSGLTKISGKIKNLAKSMVIPVTVAATAATAALGGAVSSGMTLENQQVSMKHFIGATNKDMDEGTIQKVTDEYIRALRDNSNATPFETGEVISAGARAISVANGSTAEAMSLVKLSEDMAAASGGTKSISDAMEALADAKMGEMERLKEFGFKVSADEFESKGFSGISSDLEGFFGGAAEKLAQTGSGLMSTITGKLKSSFSDFGLSVVNKLKPVMGTVVSLVDKAQPAISAFSNALSDKIGKGIEAVSSILPGMLSKLDEIKPILATVLGGISDFLPKIMAFKSGFVSMFLGMGKEAATALLPLLPQLSAFGSSVFATLTNVGTSTMPFVSSIIGTVSSLIPTVLPVLQTVITAVSSIITQAAPIISGLVDGIGTVISTLAPIFDTIFTSIGDKVGTVISFVSERMGFIQGVIGTVAPLIGDILSTAWSVISPVMDICISVFKVLFSVVQKIFPGIQKVIQSVWDYIKPIVEGIGSVIGGIADGLGWLADKITGSDSGEASVGTNAAGTNNWRGGVTWVGEKGPELVELPRGSRILPNKESTALSHPKSIVADSARPTVVREVFRSQETANLGSDKLFVLLGTISDGVTRLISRIEALMQQDTKDLSRDKLAKASHVTIAKLADSIIVREDADIDKVANAVAKKVIAVAQNM